jgi:hypothetical protein
MLKLANIKFPITFESRGVGHYTFTDKNTCHKVWSHSDKPEPSTMEIEHFIDAHNKLYHSCKDYGYAMPGYICLHYKPYKGQVLPVRSPERSEIPMVEMKTCDYKKLWCLSVDNIKYPITFRSAGNSTIRYTSRDNGVYSDGQKSEFKVDFFVNGHNKYNPHNEKDKIYYVEDITKHLFGDAPIGGGKSYFAQAIDNAARRIGEQIHSQTIKASGGWRIDKSGIACQEIVTQGAIEDMPLGASIIGIKDDNGDWQDVSFPVKQIEVHDDLICLLAHHGSYKGKAFAAELNIKRGTMVKWKAKV